MNGGVVDQAIEGGQRHGLVGKDLVPFAEGLVGGDQQGSALVAGTDQFEQHAGPCVTAPAALSHPDCRAAVYGLDKGKCDITCDSLSLTIMGKSTRRIVNISLIWEYAKW